MCVLMLAPPGLSSRCVIAIGASDQLSPLASSAKRKPYVAWSSNVKLGTTISSAASAPSGISVRNPSDRRSQHAAESTAYGYRAATSGDANRCERRCCEGSRCEDCCCELMGSMFSVATDGDPDPLLDLRVSPVRAGTRVAP